jgi:hypothetical protein
LDDSAGAPLGGHGLTLDVDQTRGQVRRPRANLGRGPNQGAGQSHPHCPQPGPRTRGSRHLPASGAALSRVPHPATVVLPVTQMSTRARRLANRPSQCCVPMLLVPLTWTSVSAARRIPRPGRRHHQEQEHRQTATTGTDAVTQKHRVPGSRLHGNAAPIIGMSEHHRRKVAPPQDGQEFVHFSALLDAASSVNVTIR